MWGKGLLMVFGFMEKVRFYNFLVYKDDFICFKDVVFFFGFIYVKYVFDEDINNWF